MSREILLLDCQTTGANPASGEIVEIGWQFLSQASVCTLVQQKDSISRRTTQLTGITEQQLRDWGKPQDTVLADLKQALNKADGVVIHYSRFELGFLKSWLEWTHPVVCTWKVARQLLPELASHSLGPVAARFGFPKSHMKRCADHLAATEKVFAGLAELSACPSASDAFQQLLDLCQQPLKKKSKKKSWLVEKPTELPKSPGVYLMYGLDDKLKYIGKATELRSRVGSYFTSKQQRRKTENNWLSQVSQVRVRLSPSPLEAALTESELIKKHQPPHNCALTNTTSPMVWLDKALTRHVDPDTNKSAIGPFRGNYWFDSLEQLSAYFTGADPAVEEFYGIEDRGFIDQALDLCRNVQPLPEHPSPRELLAYGAVSLRSHRRQPVVKSKETEEEQFGSIDKLSVEQFSERFQRKLRRRYSSYLRVRQLPRFANCRLAFYLESIERWRWLEVSGGQLRASGLGAHLPKTPGRWSETTWTPTVFDRLRILQTEILTFRRKYIPWKLQFFRKDSNKV